MAKPAWILHFKAIGQEDFFTVYLTESAALKQLAGAVVGYAQEQLEAFDWAGREPESLLSTVNAGKKGKHAAAIAAWEEYSYDHGPLDQTALLIDSQVMD